MSLENRCSTDPPARHRRARIGRLASITLIVTVSFAGDRIHRQLVRWVLRPPGSRSGRRLAARRQPGAEQDGRRCPARMSPETNNFFVGSTCADAWECWNVGGATPPMGQTRRSPESPNNGTAAQWSAVKTAGSGRPRLGVSRRHVRERSRLLGRRSGTGYEHSAIAPRRALERRRVGRSSRHLPSTATCSAWRAPGRTPAGRSERGRTRTPTRPSSLTERWNGSSWSVAPTIATGQKYSEINGVTCQSASSCWAVGTDGLNPQNSNFLPVVPAAADDQSLIAHWNGSTWSEVASPHFSDGGYLSGSPAAVLSAGRSVR